MQLLAMVRVEMVAYNLFNFTKHVAFFIFSTKLNP
ncbi:mCG141647 [Mus musculus]|nr:mCG141647 [Mus musculus]